MTKKNEKLPALTKAQRKLLDAGDVIFADAASEKDAAYIARQLVQATMPHRNPGNVPIWTRRNGNLTLAIQPGMNIETGESYGYPFGTIPRLMLFWMTSEAIRKKSPRLELGDSLAEFMLQVGLNPDNGGIGAKRSDARRLREQMERLFSARISFHRTVEQGERRGTAQRDMLVAEDKMLWWDLHNPRQRALWGSWVELGAKFYAAITSAPVPVDTRALKALKSSPLALDLYAWLSYESYRAHKTGKTRFVTWRQLQSQFGSEYKSETEFGRNARLALRKIAVVYPGLALGSLRGGILLSPFSFTAIQARPSATIDQTPNPAD